MEQASAHSRRVGRLGEVWAAALALASLAVAAPALAAPTGKVQGKVIAADTGEPIGFADVALVPADTSLRPVGGMTNADGTFLLPVPPGRYTLQVRALSYAVKRIEGVTVDAGQLVPVNTALTPEAIQQQEVVVEARARQDAEASMLTARKRATALGDAVSAEQVRKSPDKDAAEILRRVTGLSVSDGKYVFVRGLGERYSSTEVDGVRIASPEQNKRVVPLDLLPANLIDNIVVQKTYTADRPGEFGGGDLQVHTKDFPGRRTVTLSVSQGYVQGVTFQDRHTYAAGPSDFFGFGADARKLPDGIFDLAGDRPLVLSSNPANGFTKAQLAQVGTTFKDVWSPIFARTQPNAAYSGTYGDEFHVLGRSLGVIASGSWARSFNQRDEAQRFFASGNDTVYDYAVTRSTAAIQMGGVGGVSYRLSPSHTVHVRGLYTKSADDEVRIYEGPDHNRVESTTGEWLIHRDTRLLYTERSVLSGTVEGEHQFPRLLGASVDWKVSRSRARRTQPDRRETTYDRRYYYDGSGNLIGYWGLGSTGSREFGDLKDDGSGTTLSGSLPYRLGRLGSGKVTLGYDRQIKHRTNFYRRFNFYPSTSADRTAPPESLFSPPAFDGQTSSAYVEEGTLDIDNYRALQRQVSGFLAVDVPCGPRLRGNLGVRLESGQEDVKSFDLFHPSQVTDEGWLDNLDWLPSANFTWAVRPKVNVRAGASRTLSRPDLNELSPSPSLDYVGGMRVSGNPDLRRALIGNYDLRVEAFPTPSEVLAAGFFYKDLDHPIEQVIQGGAPPLLVPRNSDHGHNLGVELEARTGLGRVWRGLAPLSLNANASFISSEVRLEPQLTELGTSRHPLQGQASYLANAALSYLSTRRRAEATLLVSSVGKRLRALGLHPLPDIYDQPVTTVDATVSFAPIRGSRVKIGAKNLLDPRVRQVQGEREVSSYRMGRSYSIALSLGS